MVISDMAISSVFCTLLYTANGKEKELMEREIKWKLHKNNWILEKLNYINTVNNMLL